MLRFDLINFPSLLQGLPFRLATLQRGRLPSRRCPVVLLLQARTIVRILSPTCVGSL